MLRSEITRGILLPVGAAVEMGGCRRKQDRTVGMRVSSTEWLVLEILSVWILKSLVIIAGIILEITVANKILIFF